MQSQILKFGCNTQSTEATVLIQGRGPIRVMGRYVRLEFYAVSVETDSSPETGLAWGISLFSPVYKNMKWLSLEIRTKGNPNADGQADRWSHYLCIRQILPATSNCFLLRFFWGVGERGRRLHPSRSGSVLFFYPSEYLAQRQVVHNSCSWRFVDLRTDLL